MVRKEEKGALQGRAHAEIKTIMKPTASDSRQGSDPSPDSHVYVHDHEKETTLT